MPDVSIEDVLRSLTFNEVTVLYWKCRDLKYEEIKIKLNYSVDWVTLQMSHVYQKLGFNKEMHWTKRKEILDREVCPTLSKILENKPPKPEEWPPDIEEPVANPETYALVLYDEKSEEEEKKGEIEKVIPTPIVAIPQRPQRRGRLLFLALIVIVGCIGIGIIGYILGQRNNPFSFLVSATLAATETSTPMPTGNPTNTPTLIPSSTFTPAPTSTLTPTPTLSPTPTETKSPLGLAVGDELSDNRVTLKLNEIKYEQGRTRVGHKPLAPIIFGFVFTNHSGETILLQIGPDKFRAEDNLGNQLTCDFWNGVVETTETIQQPLENEKTFGIGAFCGEGKIPPGVTTYTLYVTSFSSLPDSTWIAELPR